MSCTDPPSVSPPLEQRIKPSSLIKVGSGDPEFVLGYWSIRGLAAPLRMMLMASGVPFWLALYDVTEGTGEADEWSRASWFDGDKVWMKKECSPFMNLPYLIDVKNQFVMTQTNAIFAHVGSCVNMMGSTPFETAKCHELLCEIYDLRDVMVGFAYNASYKGKHEACLGRAVAHFDKLEAYLTPNQTHLVGTGPTAPDFHLYEMLDQFHALATKFDCKTAPMDESSYPKLFAYKKAMEGEHSRYLKSVLHTDFPFNNPQAHFGSDPTTYEYKRGQEAAWRNKGIVILPDVKRPPEAAS